MVCYIVQRLHKSCFYAHIVQTGVQATCGAQSGAHLAVRPGPWILPKGCNPFSQHRPVQAELWRSFLAQCLWCESNRCFLGQV